MNDLISRAALFNALANVKTLEEAFAVIQRIPAVPTDKGFIPRESAIRTAINLYHKCDTGSIEDYRDMMIESFEVLAGMPLPERWIPCTERLPEEGKMVIVTIRGHDVIRCEADETLEEAIDRVMQMLRVSVGFLDEDGWNGVEGYPMMVQPVAWMPLPEPWKGEE